MADDRQSLQLPTGQAVVDWNETRMRERTTGFALRKKREIPVL